MGTNNPAKITLSIAEARQEISPMLYGLFFEDINYGADGGLYGELLKNRSFEFFSLDGSEDKRLSGWDVVEPSAGTTVRIETSNPLNEVHTNYLRLSVAASAARGGVRNRGNLDLGFSVENQKEYRFSVWARTSQGKASLSAAIENPRTSQPLGSVPIVVEGSAWQFHEALIRVDETLTDAVLTVILEQPGTVDLEMVSLFPVQTFGGRINGLRADLVHMLQDLKPSFLRFPGGCIVEGRSFDNMYRWKETIGTVSQRRTNWNRWQLDEYQRPGCSSADYFQSNGLGFFEYFLLCEDLGAQPVPVINCGMTCQWHEGLLVPLSGLDEYIQDALDLIEFANGDAATVWGKKRCDLGHPEPFGLTHLGIGNEQWNEVYFERYEAFHAAIKARYPQIRLITSSGPGVDDDYFHRAQKWMAETAYRPDLVDEHYYRSPEWFLENIDRYDRYDRSLPPIFLGEYASHTASKVEDRRNNWRAALSEAALLTGVERNSDHVVMACYAPLLARTGHHQWGPNLVWFNNAEVYGTPSYYVQKLFSNNVGRWLVSSSVAGADLRVVASLTADEREIIIKVVNLSEQPQDAALEWTGAGNLAGRGLVEVLRSDDLEAVNSHEEPRKVFPQKTTLPESEGTVFYRFSGRSLTVLRLELNRFS